MINILSFVPTVPQALLFGSVYKKILKSSILATENVLEDMEDSVVLYSFSFATCHNQRQLQLVIVITFYSPSCLGQKIAKGPFGLQAATCVPLTAEALHCPFNC